jgi:hypothetical protein
MHQLADSFISDVFDRLIKSFVGMTPIVLTQEYIDTIKPRWSHLSSRVPPKVADLCTISLEQQYLMANYGIGSGVLCDFKRYILPIIVLAFADADNWNGVGTYNPKLQFSREITGLMNDLSAIPNFDVVKGLYDALSSELNFFLRRADKVNGIFIDLRDGNNGTFICDFYF